MHLLPRRHVKRVSCRGFSVDGTYPFPDLEPKLRRVVDAYGPERVMWASDYTMIRRHASWGEALFSIRDCPSLSEHEKTWLLGRTARRVLNWPPPQKLDEPIVVRPHLTSSNTADHECRDHGSSEPNCCGD